MNPLYGGVTAKPSGPYPSRYETMANEGGTAGVPLVPIYVGRGDFY
jgi:hypothetical protein